MNSRARLAIALLAVFTATCSYDTPLHQVTFPFQVAGPANDPATGMPRAPESSFTLQACASPQTPVSQCWTVTLTMAFIALGPVYFHNQAVNVSTVSSQGRVVSQVLATFDVDVLNPTPTVVAGGGDGDNEPVGSVEMWLTEDETGAIAAQSSAGAAVLFVEGSAQRTSDQGVTETVPFNGTLALPQVGMTTPYLSYIAHHATQIPACAGGTPSMPCTFTPDNGGTLTLRVDPSHWFDFIDFHQLTTVRGASPPYDFSSPSAASQLTSGVEAPSAFIFNWSAPDM